MAHAIFERDRDHPAEMAGGHGGSTMLFVGVVLDLGQWIGRIKPLPLRLGVLTGITVMCPISGPRPLPSLACLLALSVNPTLALCAAAVYAIALTIEGNVTQLPVAALGGIALLGRSESAGNRGV